MYMSTSERLLGYNPDFSPRVVEEISELAEWQGKLKDYSAFFDHMHVNEPFVYTNGIDSNPVEILDIRREDEIPGEALVYHLPMANPLSPNMIYQAATIA